MTEQRTLPEPSERSRIGLRLGGAFVVGCIMTAVAAIGLLAFAFGGPAAGLPYLCVVGIAGTVALATLHRLTSDRATRPVFAASFGWGVGILLGSLVLVGVLAAAWGRAGFQFGQSPAVWWLLSGGAFALSAAVGTRETGFRAGLVLAALVVAAFVLAAT